MGAVAKFDGRFSPHWKSDGPRETAGPTTAVRLGGKREKCVRVRGSFPRSKTTAVLGKGLQQGFRKADQPSTTRSSSYFATCMRLCPAENVTRLRFGPRWRRNGADVDGRAPQRRPCDLRLANLIGGNRSLEGLRDKLCESRVSDVCEQDRNERSYNYKAMQ